MIRGPVILMGALLAASPAFAHAFLARANPAVGSETRVAPQAVTITLTERVEPRFSRIEVRDAAGARVDNGDTQGGDKPETLLVGLPRLPPGAYTVIWHATSVDTHKTEGKFTFTILP